MEQRVCDCQKAMLYSARVRRHKGESMDNVTLIRVVAGILAVIVFVILIFRMKRKAPR